MRFFEAREKSTDYPGLLNRNGKTMVKGRRALYKQLTASDAAALEAAAGCRVYVLNSHRL